ncbi:retrovirus-related pol polyprotein from transposon TNT 1-94 [Tanacetum coccineum]
MKQRTRPCLDRKLVNTKMMEGSSIADHLNEFNSILSRLMSVDIKFDDEVQALLLLSLLPESWLNTITAVSGSTESTKVKFNNIHDLILGEDIRRKTSEEYSNSLLSAEDKGRGRNQDRGQKQNRGRSKSKKRGQSKNRQDIMCFNCNQKGHFQNQCSKPVTSKDNEVNMAAGEYNDALVCCVENTIDDRIMDFGASFHATYCKEELERFKLLFVKVRLVDDKTLDIASIGDVVLKTYFGTSWTLKDVRYILGLKKRLIFVGQLNEVGYHIGFRDQQWKVTKGNLVVARRNKRGRLYMVEVPSDGINTTIDGRGNATLCHQRIGHMSEKGMMILASKGRIPDLQKAVEGFCEPCVLGKQKKWKATVENETNLQVKCLKSDNGGEYNSREFIEYCAKNGIRMLKTILETPQQNGVAERMNQTLNERAKRFQISEKEWQGKEVSLVHLRVFGRDSYIKVKYVLIDKLDAKFVKCTFIGYGSYEMGYRFWDSKSHKGVGRFPKNLANKNIVAKHGLSSKITQSLGGSSDTSERSKNSRSFEDSGRSNKEDSEDRASSDKGGFETPQVRRSTRESRAPVRYSPSANYFLSTENGKPESYSEALRKKALQSKWVFRVKEEQDGRKRYKARLLINGFQHKRGVDYNEIFSPVVKMARIRLVLSIVAIEDLHLEQLNNKTAFSHGNLDEDIYMIQPEGFSVS